VGIEQVLKAFYIDLPAATFRKAPLVGQFFWTVIPFLEKLPWILDAQRADPTEHRIIQGEVRAVNPTDFRPKSRLPIKVLQLRETEEFLVQRSKKRLAVVVAGEWTVFDDVAALLRQRGQHHLQESSVIVAPLYGVESPEHSGGFPPMMTAKIQSLQYRQFFHCPRNGSIREGVLRLDRLQAVRPHHLSLEPIQIALHPEALAVLLTMIRGLFGAPPDETFIALRDILRETLPV